jgi:hypothetical protein
MILHDAARDGRLLIDVGTNAFGVRYGRGSEPERELAWFDSTSVMALSEDGDQALLIESGEAGGPEYGVYLRPTDGAAAVRIGTGRATDLSSDGRWVLSVPVRARDHIALIPTGVGTHQQLRYPGLAQYDWALFAGSPRRILFTAMRDGESDWQAFVVDLDSHQAPRSVFRGRFRRDLVTPAGDAFLRWCEAEKRYCLQPLDGGEPRPISDLGGDLPVFWGQDDRTLYVREPNLFPARISRIDLATGARTPWRSLAPEDCVGLMGVVDIVANRDASAYAYWYNRRLSTLYLVDGMR